MTTMTIAGQDDAEEVSSGFIAALPTVLWQRRWWILIAAVLTTIGGTVTAYMMHPVYESSATILIEAQQISDNLINNGRDPTTDAITQRVARARARVLSRQDLIRLIRQYNLYPDKQRSLPLSKIVDTMRDATTIAAVDNAINLGQRNANTIAISIAFDYDDPVKAQAVAQQFVDRFLEVDASTQAGQATDTVNFLTEQANQIRGQIQAIESKILASKAQNGTILALGQSTGNQADDVARVDSQIVSLQADNARLLATGGTKPDTAVAAAEAQLRVAQAKYSDSHPDVLAARAQLDAARRAAASTPAAADPTAAQIAANRSQIAALQRARSMIQSSSSSTSAAQARAPLINAEIEQLQKQADNLRDQSVGIGTRLQAAEIQQRMENEQKGERLTLADPPVVPDRPTKPNRPVLILGSLVGGLALGAGIVLLIELLMHPIRGTGAVIHALGVPPLAVVPDFDRKPSWIARMIERRTRKKFARG
ncbi:GumC family protein [Sphingomonas sp. MMS24-J13]|uniref:GumC family protein n=1 Tax=Sphingomonas sp. MMS24-J13 TaxID=3238686 RepID=UPI00384C6E5E